MRDDGVGRTLLEDPGKEDPELLEDLLRLCADRVESNPTKGLALCRATVQLAPLLGHGCQVVQAYGIMSDAERSLGFLREAHQSIGYAFSITDGCIACFSTLHRKKALVRRDERNFGEAISEFNTALGFQAQASIDHDLHGHGVAKILLGRGSTFYEAGLADPVNRTLLLSSAVADISRSLSLISPTESSKLYRIGVFNLAWALSASGRKDDLVLADRNVREARRLFKGVQARSAERAKLDWLTAMVRYELRSMKLYRVCEYLKRAQQDFIELGMPQEAVAVTADLARLSFPDQNQIREYISNMEDRLSHISSELRQRLREVVAATFIEDWNAPMVLRASIEALREACGPKVLACLVSWPPCM